MVIFVFFKNIFHWEVKHQKKILNVIKDSNNIICFILSIITIILLIYLFSYLLNGFSFNKFIIKNNTFKVNKTYTK